MKSCKKCGVTNLITNYKLGMCNDCYDEEHRKASSILDSYNALKKNNDNASLEKAIEYAEELKNYHLEGIIDLERGIVGLDETTNICKKMLKERECGNCRKKWDLNEKYKEVNSVKYCVNCGQLKQSIDKNEKSSEDIAPYIIIGILAIAIWFFYYFYNRKKTEEEKK